MAASIAWFGHLSTRLAKVRALVNAMGAAHALQNTDVDADGSLFLSVASATVAMAGLRALYVLSSGVPIFETDTAKTYGTVLVIAPLQWAASRARLAEATLAFRAGLLMSLCYPLFQSVCVDIFYTGRRFPLADGILEAADRTFGLDWLVYARFFDAHPLLWEVTMFAYASIMWQFGAVLILLVFSRDAPRLYAYLLAQTLSLTAVAAVALFLPAIGAYEQSGAANAYMIHAFATGDSMTASIRWLRTSVGGPGGVDDFNLISFPSFHACCAVLFAWAAWQISYIRWAALGLNIVMAAGTPVHGSHYFVDVIAGAVVAAAAICTSTWFIRWLRSPTTNNVTGCGWLQIYSRDADRRGDADLVSFP